MELIKSIYRDDSNHLWELQRYTTPTKRGAIQEYWRLECKELSICFQEKRKYGVFTQFRWYQDNIKNLQLILNNHKN